jgi:hypothetical protein
MEAIMDSSIEEERRRTVSEKDGVITVMERGDKAITIKDNGVLPRNVSVIPHVYEELHIERRVV